MDEENDSDLYRGLVRPSPERMMFVIVDGLSWVPAAPGVPTPLEAAHTPALDALAADGICGLHETVRAGVTPGRGTAVAALLGYDPEREAVGRGVLAALGAGIELRMHDLAVQGRFATVDEDMTVTDLEGGCPDLARTEGLCRLLAERVEIPGVACTLQALRPNRFALVLRGNGLSAEVEDTDPGEIGFQDGTLSVSDVRPSAASGRRSARLVREWLAGARAALRAEAPANMVLLRGFSRRPEWPTLDETYGLRAGIVTACPLARGVARLAGIEAVPAGADADTILTAARRTLAHCDLAVVHLSPPEGDSAICGPEAAADWIERADASLTVLRDMGADVLTVAGTRTLLPDGTPSWHPVPVALWSSRCRPDSVTAMGERACAHGALGARLRTTEILPLMLANALRLRTYGA